MALGIEAGQALFKGRSFVADRRDDDPFAFRGDVDTLFSAAETPRFFNAAAQRTELASETILEGVVERLSPKNFRQVLKKCPRPHVCRHVLCGSEGFSYLSSKTFSACSLFGKK
ncbi:hypothetical protein ThimaDRAFT_3564 [Thiocapsa marina 5811]|uniref:Uncharacterized protein n=1 Tax=Thiocapsa marina 5811 TaxID=768671 RepID=F9UF61_9GAMM|nr:hypothetical protein ThimaDRAFT_3564 [Thiocapsa marina 5811]